MDFALHPIDIGIIVLYILLTIGIGFYISKKASSSIENYFLGVTRSSGSS